MGVAACWEIAAALLHVLSSFKVSSREEHRNKHRVNISGIRGYDTYLGFGLEVSSTTPSPPIPLDMVAKLH